MSVKAMTGRIAQQLAPLLLALVPLAHWPPEYRYGRWVILAAAIGAALAFRPLRPLKSATGLWFAVLPLWMCISWVANGASLLGLEPILTLSLALLAALVLAHDEKPREYAVPFLASLIIASIYGLAQAWGIIAAPRDAWGAADAASTFGLSNFAAETLVAALPMAFLLFYQDSSASTKNRIKQFGRKAGRLLLFLPIVYLLFAGSRAGWLAFAISATLLLITWRPAKPIHRLAMAGANLGFIGAVALIFGNRANILSQSDPSLNFRREAWKSAIEMGLQNPLVGVGPGRFPAFIGSHTSERLAELSVNFGRSVTHPHNEFLALFAEQGFPGILLFCGLIALLSWHLIRRRSWYGLAALAAGTTVAAVGFPLQQGSFWAAIALSIVLSLHISQGKTNYPDESDDRAEISTSRLSPLFRWSALVFITVSLAVFSVRSYAHLQARQGVQTLEVSRNLALSDPLRGDRLQARAHKLLKKSHQLWPWAPEVRFNLALASAKPAEQIGFMRSYLELMPGDARAWMSLARTEELLGDRASALHHYRRAFDLLQVPPVELYHRLVSLNLQQDDTEAALTMAVQGLEQHHDNKQLLLDQADVLRISGQTEKAALVYQKLLASSPREAGIYMRAGLAFGALGAYAEAEAALQRGADLSPKENLFDIYLAQVKLQSGDPESAKRHLMRGLTKKPETAAELGRLAPELTPFLKDFVP